MKKILTACASALLILSLSGCISTPPAETGGKPAAETSSKAPAQKEATLTVYKVSPDATHLVPVSVTVAAGNKTPKTAIEKMIATDKKEKYPLLPAGLSVKYVDVKDGAAVIDFSKELEHLEKGSTTEQLFIMLCVNTLTEFPNIKQVSFRMEGKPITHLSGHYDMTVPFKRDESYIQK
ncbi:MAG: GerMN domain-containing protein [Dialister sp.]|nr:GerMN domain-containing protein [Dialister sp.]